MEMKPGNGLPKPLCNPAGRLNKSASEVWKSTAQMNGVNLVGWVLHTCRQNALWNLVCYPLLSYSLSNSPSLYNTHCYLLSWSVLLPPPSLSYTLYIYFTSCVPSFRLLHPFVSWSSEEGLKRNRQRLSRRLPVVLKSTQLPPTNASPFPPSPPSCHAHFTFCTQMLIHQCDFVWNINGTTEQEESRQTFQLHTWTVCSAGVLDLDWCMFWSRTNKNLYYHSMFLKVPRIVNVWCRGSVGWWISQCQTTQSSMRSSVLLVELHHRNTGTQVA